MSIELNATFWARASIEDEVVESSALALEFRSGGSTEQLARLGLKTHVADVRAQLARRVAMLDALLERPEWDTPFATHP